MIIDIRSMRVIPGRQSEEFAGHLPLSLCHKFASGILVLDRNKGTKNICGNSTIQLKSLMTDIVIAQCEGRGLSTTMSIWQGKPQHHDRP
jgi:hypothetical protein